MNITHKICIECAVDLISGMAGSQVPVGPAGIWWRYGTLRTLRAHMAARHRPV